MKDDKQTRDEFGALYVEELSDVHGQRRRMSSTKQHENPKPGSELPSAMERR